jgi:hypothetical protein
MPNLSKAPRPMMALTWEDGGSALDDPFSQQEKGKITFRIVRSVFGRKVYDN